jgi:hypothetical protein
VESAGDVDQHVDAPETHRDRRHCLAGGLEVGQVSAAEQHVARSSELALQLGRGLCDVDQRQPGTRLREDA